MRVKDLICSESAKLLFANFAWLTILKFVSYTLPLITLPYLSRIIGAQGIGEIAFALSIIAFIETFVDYGFNYTATRDIARNRENTTTVSHIFSNVLWAKLCLMGIALLILIILVTYVPSLKASSKIIFLTFLYIPGHIIFPDWFFQAMEKMKYITLLNVLSKVIFTALIFIVIKDKSDYVWQPLLVSIGYFISGVISMYYIVRKFNIRILRPEIHEIISSIRQSTSLFITLLVPNLYTNFSFILLSSACGGVATGIYDAANKFVGIIQQLLQVLSRTFYPFLSRKIDKHRVYVYISSGFCILSCIFLFFGAKFLISTFFTDEFSGAINALKILAFSPIGLLLTDVFGTNYLVLRGAEKQYRNITIIFSIIGFCLSWLLTPLYSFIGAAIAITLTRLIGGIMTYTYSKFIFNKISCN